MNIKSLIKVGIISHSVLILVLSINTASAAKLYKWVDAEGRISYQGNPPPADSKVLSEKTIKNRVSAKTKSSLNTDPIDVYVTKTCSSCDRIIQKLKDWGVPYTEQAIDEHRDIQARLLDLTGGVNVPSLFYDDKLLDSISTTKLLRESLERTGHLQLELSDAKDDVKKEENTQTKKKTDNKVYPDPPEFSGDAA